MTAIYLAPCLNIRNGPPEYSVSRVLGLLNRRVHGVKSITPGPAGFLFFFCDLLSILFGKCFHVLILCLPFRNCTLFSCTGLVLWLKSLF